MKIQIQNVRLSFPHLFQPQANNNGEGDPKYNLTAIVDPGSDNEKKILSVIETVAREKWGEKGATTLAALRKGDKVAYRESEKTNQSGEVYAGFEGKHWFSASSKVRPTVIDRDKSPLTSADGKPYGGCYVNIIVDCYAQDNAYGKRINFDLKGVQFVKDGDAFSGGGAASVDEFDVVEFADADDLT
jgi:hypothetical protein